MTECGRRRLLRGVGIATVAGVLGSGVASADAGDSEPADGDWPSARGNPGNTGYISDADGPGASAAVAWEYDHGGPIAVVDGIVYLVVDGEVHALDAESGEQVGRTDDIGAAGGPTVTGDSVYVGGEQLTAIDLASGEPDWIAGTDRDDTISAPTVTDGRALVVTDGALYAVEADDGDDLWRFAPDEPLLERPPAVADGAAFVTDGETLYAIELDDGAERWTADGSFGTGEVMATGRAVFAQLDDETGVYDTGTGEGIWANPGTPGLTTQGTHANVYTRGDDALVGYRRNTGEEFWRTPDELTAVGLPVASGPTIYVGVERENTGIGAFDVEDDEVEWTVETESEPEYLAVAGDTVYASADGLVAIRADDDTDEEFDGDEADDAGNESDTNETDANETDADNATDANNATDGEAGDDVINGGADDTDGDADDESTPGFTAGAGIAGGAVALEWLRRRAGVADDEA
jgi:outer membrane protein assembly factor BamB